MSRRSFLYSSTVAGSGLLLLAPGSIWGAPANSMLNLALIGVGGRGSWFVDSMPKLNTRFAAICDVRDDRLEKVGQKFPEAKRFHDFRVMLEEMRDKIDGVIVAAPDHIHGVASAKAMRLGKPVLCEKPLTRTIEEARMLREIARTTKVATQMGNQGTSSEPFQRATEIIQSGTLGDIKEIIAWNEGGGGDNHSLPGKAEPVPDGLHWDLFLGPRPSRPYAKEWTNWHRWRDFATGQLGNWAVHSTNVAFKAFQLDQLWKQSPGNVRVTARVSEQVPHTFPKWELITFEAPARGKLPPVKLTWCNGRAPDGRERVENLLSRKLDWGDAGEKKWRDYAGVLISGTRGLLHSTGHNMSFSMHPKEAFVEVMAAPLRTPPSPGHENEWLRAVRGGVPACSNFVDYGSLLTEFLLLGNVATQLNGTLEYDPTAGRFVKNTAADRFIHANPREGWAI